MPSYIRRRGKVEAQVMIHGKRYTKTHPTKREAVAWVNQVKADHGSDPTHGKAFSDLLKRYEKEVSRGKRGWKWEKDRINLLCRDEMADVRLRDLSASDVASWRDRRLRSVSPGSVRREWTMMSHACNVAIREWQWLRENPFKGVTRPANPPPRTRRISQDEIDRILIAGGYSEPPETITARVCAAFLFAIETAMRAGEIAGLTWPHVHPKYVHLPRTKNGNSRDVPLSKRAREIVDSLQGIEEERVFGLSSDQISSLFRKIRDRCMIDDLHFHDTRREALSRMAKKLDVMQLAKVSGHRDLRILQAVYYAPEADELADLLD